MSIFGKIKDAIFGHRAVAPAAAPTPAPAPAPVQMDRPGADQAAPTSAGATATVAPAPPSPPKHVDPAAAIEEIARAKGNPDLNYKTSIVDLMKLLDLDSSLENRKELATELGYQGAKDGSAEMNIWLHEAVMTELGLSGGAVPAHLKD